MNTQDIRKLLEQDKLIIGYNEVRQAVADSAVSAVYVASNAEDERKSAMVDYCDLSDISLTELEVRNDQLGTMCRKPFAISFLAVKA